MLIRTEGGENMRNTPWGNADWKNELAPGIIFYSTPSHGGIWLSEGRRKALVAKYPEMAKGNYLATTNL